MVRPPTFAPSSSAAKAWHRFSAPVRRAFRSNHGPAVMEVTAIPGLEGIETARGIYIAGIIVEFLEKNARPNKTRRRGDG